MPITLHSVHLCKCVSVYFVIVVMTRDTFDVHDAIYTENCYFSLQFETFFLMSFSDFIDHDYATNRSFSFTMIIKKKKVCLDIVSNATWIRYTASQFLSIEMTRFGYVRIENSIDTTFTRFYFIDNGFVYFLLHQ